MGVTNHFLIRFKAHSMLWNPYLTAIMTKNLILDSYYPTTVIPLKDYSNKMTLNSILLCP